MSNYCRIFKHQWDLRKYPVDHAQHSSQLLRSRQCPIQNCITHSSVFLFLFEILCTPLNSITGRTIECQYPETSYPLNYPSPILPLTTSQPNNNHKNIGRSSDILHSHPSSNLPLQQSSNPPLSSTTLRIRNPNRSPRFLELRQEVRTNIPHRSPHILWYGRIHHRCFNGDISCSVSEPFSYACGSVWQL